VLVRSYIVGCIMTPLAETRSVVRYAACSDTGRKRLAPLKARPRSDAAYPYPLSRLQLKG